MSGPTIRLQKYLAERGVASRRAAADLIRNAQVCVDGKPVVVPGARIQPARCDVTVAGRPVPAETPPMTLLLYKPRGAICSRAAAQGRTVYELIDGLPANVVTVGRLDKNSEGLLLLSNDGVLVNRLTHPRYGHRKTYRVTVSGAVTAQVMRLLRSRMVLDGYRIQPVEVTRLKADPAASRTVLRFVLGEGRNRQIRQMCRRAGLTVHRLVRTHIDGLSIRGLRPGEWRSLPPPVVARLRAGGE